MDKLYRISDTSRCGQILANGISTEAQALELIKLLKLDLPHATLEIETYDDPEQKTKKQNLCKSSVIPRNIYTCDLYSILPLMKNFKQRHLELSQQLQDQTIDYISRQRLQQTLHYIEVEYEYRPRYSTQQLKHSAKHKHTKHRPRCSKQQYSTSIQFKYMYGQYYTTYREDQRLYCKQ